MSDGPMGELPNTDSSESFAPLKLIEYPPNAFLPFAILYPPKRFDANPTALRAERLNHTISWAET